MHIDVQGQTHQRLLCRVPALKEWAIIVSMLLGESLGESAWTDLLLVLKNAAHKACGGALSLLQPDGRCAPMP